MGSIKTKPHKLNKTILNQLLPWKNIPKDLDKYQGFVYLIINKVNNKKYVGKKYFWKTKKLQPLKGKKNKRHFKVESDWKLYCGSNNQLKRDIELIGPEMFERIILLPCKTKFDCSYAELVFQIKEDVLFREDYYNGIIQVRLNSNMIKKMDKNEDTKRVM